MSYRNRTLAHSTGATSYYGSSLRELLEQVKQVTERNEVTNKKVLRICEGLERDVALLMEEASTAVDTEEDSGENVALSE